MQTDLISKLQKAGEGSSGLDAMIFRAVGEPMPDQFANLKLDLEWQPDGTALMPVGEMRVRYNPPAYTSSLDAVTGLIERKLPGAAILMGARQTEGTVPWARVGTWRDADATAPTLPLALCIALLTALQHQGAE